MPKRSPTRFVPLIKVLAARFPGLDVGAEVRARHVWVDGGPVTNPNTRVRADASIRLRAPHRLRGHIKLAHALRAFDLSVAGRTCADIGASAGGFTTALLAAGAARVYAIDTAVGQLQGRLRADPRVVNLEGHNLANLSADQVTEPVEVITVDLSYLALADAIPQLDAIPRSANTDLVTLVKPTFELHSGTLVIDEPQIRTAVTAATQAITAHGWHVTDTVTAPRTGRAGAVEVFIHAHTDLTSPSQAAGGSRRAPRPT